MTSGRSDDSPAPDMLPVVGADQGNRPLWIGLTVIGLVATGMFAALEGRRQRQLQPVVGASASRDAAVAPYVPPPLVLPALPQPPLPTPAEPPALAMETAPAPAASPALPPRDAVLAPPPVSAVAQPSPPAAQPSSASSASVIVYDVTTGDTAVAAAAPAPAPGNAGARPGGLAYATRGRASRLTTIVPRGTLIPAILETALDSTQPGQARALISEDVRNLTGDRVLIPRGSRLFGEYKADLAAGQRRAFVQWTELVRPDGAVIAIESPATDPLGRAGVRGRVNTHFAGRLGGALLQSAIDFGTLAAAQSLSSSSVIIAGPALQAGTSQLVGPPPKPTLSVQQGAKISVLVARDLEFAAVEADQ